MTPGFHGVEERAGQRFLCMENLTLGCKMPCIMDIKVSGPNTSQSRRKMQCNAMRVQLKSNPMKDKLYSMICFGQVGARTWGPDASLEKQESQDRSYAATKEPFGFSVPGLSVHTGPDRQQVGSDSSVNLLSSSSEVVTKGKEFGKQLNAENIDTMLELYLDREHHPATAAALAMSEIIQTEILD